MITYKIEDTQLRVLLNTTLLQFFVKGGGVQFIPPQLTSEGEFIAVFQKDKNAYIKLHIKLEGSIFQLKENTKIQMELDFGTYPEIDFKTFDCSIENPYRHSLSNIEIIYYSQTNVTGEKILYFKGLVFSFYEGERLIVYLEDTPKSFCITIGNDLLYKQLISNCVEKIRL